MESALAIEEKASLTYPLYVAFLLPLAIGLLGFFGLFDAIFYWPLSCFLFFLMAYLPFIKALKALSEHISSTKPFFITFFKEFTLIPGGYVYGTDLKKGAIPVATIGLITANAFISIFSPESIGRACVFVPYGHPSPIQVFLSMFTCTFLHAGWSHLIGNMLFLWVLGSVVEPRIGSFQFLCLYFACTLTSGVFVAVLLLLKAALFDTTLDPGAYHSLGASGAIAGIMGIFVVRCYFSRLKMAVPFFFFPVLSLSTKVNASVLLGLFFTFDFAGSVTQLTMDSDIDYWAHVGGYVGGLVMAYMLKLHKDASREALKVGADRMTAKPLGKKEATKRYREILDQEPENEKALRYLLELHRFNEKKRGYYFSRLVGVVAKRDFSEALTLFEDHFPTLTKTLPGNQLLRFGLYYYRSGYLEKAWPCLELASEKEGSWQAKAMYTLGIVYKEMGRHGMARDMLERVVCEFKGTPFHKAAMEELHNTSRKLDLSE